MCEPIFDTYHYESALETEAEIMIALESMRLAMIELQTDVTTLEDCIPPNDVRIAENQAQISTNADDIDTNELRIQSQ